MDGLQQAWARQCRVWMPTAASRAIAAYLGGASLAEAGASVGRSPIWMRDRLIEAGIPRRSRGNPERGLRDQDRAARIIAERERGDSYDAIGFRLGITRERVRQILHKAGRSDLCRRGHAAPRLKNPVLPRECAHCRTVFKPLSRKARFCSQSCFGESMEKLSHAEMHRRLNIVIADRQAGSSWTQIAAKLGMTQPQAERRLHRDAKLWAKRLGITLPWREA